MGGLLRAKPIHGLPERPAHERAGYSERSPPALQPTPACALPSPDAEASDTHDCIQPVIGVKTQHAL